MTVEVLTLEAAVEQGKQLPWALIRRLSDVTLGASPESFSAEELLEARFFSENQEIRIFRDGETMRAVRLGVEPDDEYLEECRVIENPAFGKNLTVRKILTYDEDGQCCVKTTMPVKWEGGNANG